MCAYTCIYTLHHSVLDDLMLLCRLPVVKQNLGSIFMNAAGEVRNVLPPYIYIYVNVLIFIIFVSLNNFIHCIPLTILKLSLFLLRTRKYMFLLLTYPTVPPPPISLLSPRLLNNTPICLFKFYLVISYRRSWSLEVPIVLVY